jgi:outer membrane immunogenic protein
MGRFRFAALAAVAVFGFFSAASAADLPAKAPRAPVAAPAFSWTGFYLGIHAGYGWSNSTATVTDSSGTLAPASLDQNGDGFIGGGQIGYNWQFAPNWVVGVEADISGTGIRNTTIVQGADIAGNLFFGFNQMAERDVKWLASVRGRLGYAVDRYLIYVSGGAAWADVDYTAGPAWGNLYNPVTFNHNSSGWTLGGGFEYAFTNNWTARLEYLHYDLDGATIANPSGGALPGFAATQTWDRNVIDVVRAGVNYKF